MISESTSSILMLVALFALMYFMLIRPQRKKEKQTQEMRANLKPGDEIVTIGGIFGKVVRVKDEEVTIQVGADKTKIEVAKWGISSTVTEVKVSGGAKTDKTDKEEEKPSGRKMRRLGKKEEPEQVEEFAEAVAETVSETAEAVETAAEALTDAE